MTGGSDGCQLMAGRAKQGLAMAAAAARPGDRPLARCSRVQLETQLKDALAARDGCAGAHCIHELWMRGEMAVRIERMLELLWKQAADDIPEWLPMHYIEWLPTAYDVSARCRANRRGRSNLYLVLLDYQDSRADPYGVYVGMTHYPPASRFDQHKAGIRAAGSVLRRGLEVLHGPVAHLQGIARSEAERIEGELAEALRAAGLFVQGGH